jgi:hypothetical protein
MDTLVENFDKIGSTVKQNRDKKFSKGTKVGKIRTKYAKRKHFIKMEGQNIKI